MLEKHGLPARHEGPEALSPREIRQLNVKDIRVVCLCYLDAGTPAHIRYTVKRLRRWLPGATILVGCWTADAEPAIIASLCQATTADAVAGSLREMTALCLQQAAPESAAAAKDTAAIQAA